jgi:hypothetical protein
MCGGLEKYDAMIRRLEKERGLKRGALDGKMFPWRA